MAEEEKTFKVPKTLGGCADRLQLLRNKKAAVNKQLKEISDEHNFIKKHLIVELNKAESTGVMGRSAKAAIIKREFPTVKDWKRLYNYIYRNKAFHFLQRRVARDAVKEIWESGKKVPGVDKFVDFDLSITKRR